MKKPYTQPQLVCHGHLKDIVKGSTGHKVDSGTSKPCWVAASLYGEDSPRTLLLRAWLAEVYEQNRRGASLVGLYRRFGRATAGALQRSRLLRVPFRALFDRLVIRAAEDQVWRR
jgi:hypothetical protein